jgi:hypothetical protein
MTNVINGKFLRKMRRKDGTGITLLGLTANTEVTEYTIPSELPQGICVHCVSEAWMPR